MSTQSILAEFEKEFEVEYIPKYGEKDFVHYVRAKPIMSFLAKAIDEARQEEINKFIAYLKEYYGLDEEYNLTMAKQLYYEKNRKD